jgi:carboxyl-terminal processing protease
MPSPPSRRPPLVSVLAALLPILLVAGLYLGGHPEDLPTFIRRAFVKNAQAGVVSEAIDRISHDYYRPIPTSKLTNSSIAGAVASLGDRFSHYLTPFEFREFNAPPHFAGIGVVVDPQKRGLLIGRVFDSSPASHAGLKAGELIVGVGAKRLVGIDAEAAT